MELCYNMEGLRFETRCGKLYLSIYPILLAALGPGVYSASNINEYQRQNNFLGSITLVMSKADNLTAICEPAV
jgi:hypothetical protein